MTVQKLRGSGYSGKGRGKGLITSTIRVAMMTLDQFACGSKEAGYIFLHSEKLAWGGDG